MVKLPNTLPKFFWHFLKPEWKLLLFIQVCFLSWSIDSAFWPYVLQILVDRLNTITDRSQMWSIVALPVTLGASLWIFVEFSNRLHGFLRARLNPRLQAAVRMQMFDYIQRHSYRYFSTHLAGSIGNRVNDMAQTMTQMLEIIMALLVPSMFTVILSTILFARLQPVFALILLGWIFVHILICIAFARSCDQASDIAAEARSTLSGRVIDSLSSILSVKSFARYNFEKHYLWRYQREEQKLHQRALITLEKMKMVLGVACFLGAGVAINWYMLSAWQKGIITTGEVVFIFNSSWNITIMAWLSGLELPNLYRDFGVCRQALTIIQEKHEITDALHAKPLRVTNGQITFDHVTFRYAGADAIFQDKTIALKPHEKVGLVGFSGSGKTTFVNLILRFYDVDSGRILIDGQDISQVTQDSLRSQIAMIPQDPALFHRTLIENIRYGNPDATDAQVFEAARKAHCTEFIERIPEGYQALVGERGVRLSGGQRQRIAIARAILKNAPILILDEATSMLDSVTEKYIQDGLEHLMKGRTVIVIAHRLSTLAGMDRILVFDEGHIVEEGTHKQLLVHKGHYATMWAMQAGGFLPDAPVSNNL